MSKLQFPLRTYQDRSLADVRAYWLEEHDPLIRKNAVVSSIVRYVQVHRIDSNWNERLAELSQSESEPYLGHAEVWVARSGSSATDEERALASKAAVLTSKFIDFTRSTLFFVEGLSSSDASLALLIIRNLFSEGSLGAPRSTLSARLAMCAAAIGQSLAKCAGVLVLTCFTTGRAIFTDLALVSDFTA